MKQLWQELQSRGFRGRYKSVWQFTRGWQPPDLPQAVTPARVHPSPVTRTPRQTTWVPVRPPEALEPDESAYREVLCRRCPEVATAYPLAQAFTALLRTRAVDALEPWLVQAQQCGVREVARFALGLRQDYAAVRPSEFVRCHIGYTPRPPLTPN